MKQFELLFTIYNTKTKLILVTFHEGVGGQNQKSKFVFIRLVITQY